MEFHPLAKSICAGEKLPMPELSLSQIADPAPVSIPTPYSLSRDALKVVAAAQEQLNAIRTLKENGLYDNLPAKLQQAAAAREENPEASLTELATMMEPPISKPAMNHRLKKLVELTREETL